MSAELARERNLAAAKDVQRVEEVVSEYFVGHRDVVRKTVAGCLARGHILFEDHPGLGKTLLVKVLARTLQCEFARVQFTPDILPSDILGARVWEHDRRAFEMQKGPVFTQILLADEINRAPPKTQSALLEAMEERQVTIDGETMHLDQPFFVLATQNPIEQEGTYPLPEAQMDRFLLRLHTGYPETQDEEKEILRRRMKWQVDDPTERIKPVMSKARLLQVLDATEKVFVHEEVLNYITALVRGLREHPHVEVGPSPRGALALLKTSRALALLAGRDFVVPDDVKAVAREALAHRTILKVERVLEGENAETAVDEVVKKTPATVPRARP
ncbi:MAG TPA: MoxR family ATPase [Candidatus Thermoplasmatota archaeon]|nr:MoxR family ATPase [Candidatus Thermoplasmatota archaeon]